MIVCQYDDEENQFKKLDFQKETGLYSLLNPDSIFMFIDPLRYRVWIWYGKNATSKMKLLSAKIAPRIRDRYAFAFKLASVEEGNEPKDFKLMIGLEKT
ncbi:MAG: hypothetical protein ACFFCC_20190 [Promethearchaeota archaeon]